MQNTLRTENSDESYEGGYGRLGTQATMAPGCWAEDSGLLDRASPQRLDEDRHAGPGPASLRAVKQRLPPRAGATFLLDGAGVIDVEEASTPGTGPFISTSNALRWGVGAGGDRAQGQQLALQARESRSRLPQTASCIKGGNFLGGAGGGEVRDERARTPEAQNAKAMSNGVPLTHCLMHWLGSIQGSLLKPSR